MSKLDNFQRFSYSLWPRFLREDWAGKFRMAFAVIVDELATAVTEAVRIPVSNPDDLAVTYELKDSGLPVCWSDFDSSAGAPVREPLISALARARAAWGTWSVGGSEEAINLQLRVSQWPDRHVETFNLAKWAPTLVVGGGPTPSKLFGVVLVSPRVFDIYEQGYFVVGTLAPLFATLGPAHMGYGYIQTSIGSAGVGAFAITAVVSTDTTLIGMRSRQRPIYTFWPDTIAQQGTVYYYS